MMKNFEGGSALIEQWLKNKGTVLFLGVWEKFITPVLIPSNSRKLKMKQVETISTSLIRNGVISPELLAYKPRQVVTVALMPIKILLLSSAHGSALNSSFI